MNINNYNTEIVKWEFCTVCKVRRSVYSETTTWLVILEISVAISRVFILGEGRIKILAVSLKFAALDKICLINIT